MGHTGLEGKKNEPTNLPQPMTGVIPCHHPQARTRHHDYSSGSGRDYSTSSSSTYPRYTALESSVSEATTETMVLSPSSDSEPGMADTGNNGGANSSSGGPQSSSSSHQAAVHNLMYYPLQSRKLPPHQGLNPTVERNTHKSSDEEISVRGNTLINTKNSSRGSKSTGGGVNGPGAEEDSPLLNDAALIDAITENLVRNDLLLNQNPQQAASESNSATSPGQMSSFHDNQVSSEPLIIRHCPKQPNLPQSGNSPKPKSLFGRFRKPKSDSKSTREQGGSSSGSSRGFSLPFFHRNAANGTDKSVDSGNGSSEENMENLVEIRPGGHHRSRSSEGGNASGSARQQQKSNLTQRPAPSGASLSTEVRLVNGNPVVQPSTSTYAGPAPSAAAPPLTVMVPNIAGRPIALNEDEDSSPGSVESGDSGSARRPNSLLLPGGHRYTSPQHPAPMMRGLVGGEINIDEGISGMSATANSSQSSQPGASYAPPPPPPQTAVYNVNELPQQNPVNANIYPPPSAPLSVNVMPGVGGDATGGGARGGGGIRVGGVSLDEIYNNLARADIESGPPPNVNLPRDWNSKCNLQRAAVVAAAAAANAAPQEPQLDSEEEGEGTASFNPQLQGRRADDEQGNNRC